MIEPKHRAIGAHQAGGHARRRRLGPTKPIVRRLRRLVAAITVVAAILTTGVASYATTGPHGPDYRIHPGDTLYRIHLKFHRPVHCIARRNGIRNVNLIYAGHVIRIPLRGWCRDHHRRVTPSRSHDRIPLNHHAQSIAGYQDYARARMDGGQYACFAAVVARESGWNRYARNPSSGAYGIPQALPGSKMATAGSDWSWNGYTQVRWMIGYVRNRYGSPCGAWSFWQNHGWY